MTSSPVLRPIQTSFRRLVKTILVKDIRTNIGCPKDIATTSVLAGSVDLFSLNLAKARLKLVSVIQKSTMKLGASLGLEKREKFSLAAQSARHFPYWLV